MRRLLILGYGSLSYLFFFGVFVYAIGFVGGVAVPKTIDSGATSPLGETLLVNTLLLSLFAVQHSGMARRRFKQALTRFVPAAMERPTYVLATSAALALLFWQWRPLPDVIWTVESNLRAAAYGVYLTGWAVVLLSTLMIHHFDLFGLRQAWLGFRGVDYTPLGFRTPGLYRYMRHPIQAGFLMAFWAAPTMTVGHLMFSIVTTAYIIVVVKFFEEPDLLREFGARYREYMSQVSGFLPLKRYRRSAETPAMAASGD